MGRIPVSEREGLRRADAEGQRGRRETVLPAGRARRGERLGYRHGGFNVGPGFSRAGHEVVRMMEAEGEFAGAALRFSVALAQRDFHAELHRLFRSAGWAQTLTPMRLLGRNEHKERGTRGGSL